MATEYSKGRSLKIQVADRMRDLIASGEWQVGESVGDVMKLADRFGVSFGTVRAAEEILVQEGLLHPIRPGIPTRVAAKPSTSSDLREVIGVIEVLREQLGTVVAKLESLAN
jgi:DNA-binding GntR family transcriptional regulator